MVFTKIYVRYCHEAPHFRATFSLALPDVSRTHGFTSRDYRRNLQGNTVNKPQAISLEQALLNIALYLNVDAATLMRYAAEDPHDGWDEGRGSWPVGSLWTVEGKVLYALIRTLGLKNALELGTRYGCSATHMAEALKANGAGKLTTVDLYVHGETELMIPPHLSEYVNHVRGEAVAYIASVDDAPDLIFEDLDHEAATTAAVAGIARKRLNPGGLLVVHDAMHFLVGERVRKGLEMAEMDARMWLIAPSDCGLAVWQKPKEVTPKKTPHTTGFPAKEEKPKRKVKTSE